MRAANMKLNNTNIGNNKSIIINTTEGVHDKLESTRIERQDMGEQQGSINNVNDNNDKIQLHCFDED